MGVVCFHIARASGVDGSGMLLKVDFKAKAAGVSALKVRGLKLGTSGGTPMFVTIRVGISPHDFEEKISEKRVILVTVTVGDLLRIRFCGGPKFKRFIVNSKINIHLHPLVGFLLGVFDRVFLRISSRFPNLADAKCISNSKIYYNN